MGARGPAPKDARLKVLEGNPGFREIQSQLGAKGDLGEPPATLSDREKATWNEIASAMEGIYSAADRHILEAFCVTFWRWRDVHERLAQTGDLVKSGGKVQRNPLFVPYNQLATTMRGLGGDLGLSPAARARIGSTVDDKDKEDEEYLRLIGAA